MENREQSLNSEEPAGCSPAVGQLLSPAQLADRLGVPVSWVYARTMRRSEGGLPHAKLGRYVRFSWPKVERWIERQSF